MNCAECRDNLVGCAEGWLEAVEALACQSHLESCAACRAEFEAITRLQKKLTARGQIAANISLVQPVMRRVREASPERESHSIMNMLFRRWGIGLGALAGAAAVIVVLLLTSPQSKATAAEMLARGARAVSHLTSIHLRGQLRTLPADNFSYINPDCDFVTVELWKQLEPELKWRAEKPGRVVVMDGQSTVHYLKVGNQGVKVPQRTTSAFDTDWLHRIANLSSALSNELKNAVARGWNLELAQETAANGERFSIVTIHTTSGVPDDDYVKNSFLESADTRRVYRFNARTELLESVQIFLVRPGGELLIFDLSQIDFNQSIDSAVWQLQLPADVSWYQQPQKLPDNDRYVAMTAEQAARTFFEACGREDWDEAGKFMSPFSPRLKEYLGGVEVVSLGQAFTSQAYGGRFVPYEIKLRPRVLNVRMSNANAAKRYVIAGVYDSKLQLQQDLSWKNEPAILADNDAYAKLTPAEAAAAYFRASRNLDWEEMKKFAPDYDVEKDKNQALTAEKAGMDVRELIPAMEVVDEFWSAEHSTYFVTCRVSESKKHNLALRNDNPSGRWQVDGGL